MYLHEDKELFKEAIHAASNQTGIAQSIVEKDYYVTAILKQLADKSPQIVFKGGTSLSKCFHLIDRFSEDIDVTFPEYIGEARRKKLKYNVIQSIGGALSMPIKNWDKVESDRDYNFYLFEYQPIFKPSAAGMVSEVKLETALSSYAFPTEKREVESLIYSALKDETPDIFEGYNLEPFSMNVQSVSRTFIDKVFALCDYYMEGKTRRYSRHLYDIYKIYPVLVIDREFKDLVEQVREHRSHLSICPSAKDDTDIKALINEALDKAFYKSDYDNITRALISDHVTYEQAAETLKKGECEKKSVKA